MKAKKSLGQNFLQDKSVLDKIIETADLTSTDEIIEVGPGHGILTEELAKSAKKVTTIELDDRLIPNLKVIFALHDNIELIHQNALDFPPPSTPYKLVANIPYYITSPLISHFLHTPDRPTKIVLLVQKEVAEKICVDKKMNVLALHVQNFGKPQIIATVPPSAFRPSPKVDSAILEIDVYKKPIIQDHKALFRLVHQAFSQSRKKLSNSLYQHKEALTELDLQDKRAERLTLKDWEALLSIVDQHL
ncbi:MAG: 16S rRNA (adenine(1518)-N(6)/adenine(1519)-N(6))-dimethyltransferase RsmA [Nitrospirota bacterium]